jgi:hypothetical protein
VWSKREYYFRTQDGNRPVPTAVLRRMFYPQNFPFIVPVANASIHLSGDGFYHLQMSVDLRNRGTASGEDIAIHFVPINQQSRPFYDSNRWTLEVRSDGFYFRCQTTVHPGDRLPWLSNCTSDARDWTEPGRPLLFRFRIFARNTPARGFLLSFSSAELGAHPGVAIKREAVSEE